jgi:trigger factor
MEISVENTGGLTRRMTVQVPAERVDQEVESRLQSMSGTVRLDGFRPGKVPLKVVEQKFGTQVRSEVVNQVINTSLQEALSQENLRLVGDPQVEPKNTAAGGPLEYVASFEVFPELSGGIHYNFSISRPLVEVTEDDVRSMLENLRKQRATWNEVAQAAKTGDQVTIDFEGSISGEAFTGNKGQKMPLVIGSGSMIPGFEEQLVGLSAGEEKVLELSFPDDYPSAEVAGKAAEFQVKVHSVAETVLPELNDEFAMAFGIKDGGIDALRQEINANMQRELQGLITSKMKDQVFKGLLENNPIEMPRSLIETEIQTLQSQDKYQGQDAGTLADLAERRVKLGLLVSEIAKINQIELDQNRVRQLVETVAASYEKPEEVVQWYFGNQEMLAGVQSAVIEEQVVDWVVASSGASVEDVQTTFSELVEEAKQSQG